MISPERAHEPSALRRYDLERPLDPDDLINARAILHAAGREPNSQARTDFAFYHRKQVESLTADPTVNASEMVYELFDALPARLDEGLLSNLRREIITLQARREPPSVFSVSREADEKVNLSKIGDTEHKALLLFSRTDLDEPDPYLRHNRAIKDNVPELRKKASQLQSYDNKVHTVISAIGLPLRFGFVGSKSLIRKSAMALPTAAAIALFVPVALGTDIYRQFKHIGPFRRLAEKTYPNLRLPMASDHTSDHNNVIREFAKEYLARTDTMRIENGQSLDTLDLKQLPPASLDAAHRLAMPHLAEIEQYYKQEA